MIDQDRAGSLCRGRGGDPRAPSLRTSGDRRCPRHRWPARYLDWIDAETRRDGPQRRVCDRSARARDRRPRALSPRAVCRIAAARRWRAGAQAARARAGVRVQRARRSTTATVEVRFAIADGYYLYRDKLKFALEPAALAGPPRCRRARSRRTSSSARSRPTAACSSSGSRSSRRARVDGDRQGRVAGLRRRRRLLPAASSEGHRGAAGGRRAARAPRSRPRREEVAGSTDRRAASGAPAACVVSAALRVHCFLMPRPCPTARPPARRHRRRLARAGRGLVLRRRVRHRRRGRAASARRPLMALTLPDVARDARNRSANGRARCWSSTSGRPGARRAARRCRSSCARRRNSAREGLQFVGIAVDEADKVRPIRRGDRPQLPGADRRLWRDGAVADAGQPARRRCRSPSSSTATGRIAIRNSGRSRRDQLRRYRSAIALILAAKCI